jgi:23S rRNA (pseudouridine1915-N3)-methyltransferase
MRVAIITVGRLKDQAERDIVARYLKRLDATGRPCGIGPTEIIEFSESRAASPAQRKAEEGEKILASLPGAVRIALDVRGRALGSEAFAADLKSRADSGAKACAFLIGGPDGLSDAVLSAADLRLSLGPLTLPHGLARVILAEQLYRAATILTGHPYHRA